MSRAKRTNKRRLLGVGLAGSVLITGIVATGAALADDDGEQCSTLDAPSSTLDAKAKEGTVVNLEQLDGKVARLLKPLGVDQGSLQNLDDTLQSIPSDEADLVVQGIGFGSGQAPQVTLTSMDQKTPEEWAQANPNVDLAPMNAQLASLNDSLDGLFGELDGLGGLILVGLVQEIIQSGFGGGDINIGIDDISIDDINADDININLRKADAGNVEIKATSLTKCQ